MASRLWKEDETMGSFCSVHAAQIVRSKQSLTRLVVLAPVRVVDVLLRLLFVDCIMLPYHGARPGGIFGRIRLLRETIWIIKGREEWQATVKALVNTIFDPSAAATQGDAASISKPCLSPQRAHNLVHFICLNSSLRIEH